jgi:hypothetical protein
MLGELTVERFGAECHRVNDHHEVGEGYHHLAPFEGFGGAGGNEEAFLSRTTGAQSVFVTVAIEPCACSDHEWSPR